MVNVEGIKWENVPLRTDLLIVDLKTSVCNNTIETDLANAFFSDNVPTIHTYSPISQPYPGWVTSGNTSSELPIIVYVGNITSNEILLVVTLEAPDTAAFFLKNLRVYPIADKDALTRRKVAEGLQ